MEPHHWICLGMATRYSLSPFTAHSPSPSPRHLCWSGGLPDGVIQTFTPEGCRPLVTRPFSVCGICTGPPTVKSRQDSSKRGSGGSLGCQIYSSWLHNVAGVLFPSEDQGNVTFLLAVLLAKKMLLLCYSVRASPYLGWPDLRNLGLWLMGHSKMAPNLMWVMVNCRLLIFRPIHTTYWDCTHSGHWFRMYTIAWWMVTHLCKAASPRGIPAASLRGCVIDLSGWQLLGSAVFDGTRKFHDLITSAITLSLHIWSFI